MKLVWLLRAPFRKNRLCLPWTDSFTELEACLTTIHRSWKQKTRNRWNGSAQLRFLVVYCSFELESVRCQLQHVYENRKRFRPTEQSFCVERLKVFFWKIRFNFCFNRCLRTGATIVRSHRRCSLCRRSNQVSYMFGLCVRQNL